MFPIRVNPKEKNVYHLKDYTDQDTVSLIQFESDDWDFMYTTVNIITKLPSGKVNKQPISVGVMITPYHREPVASFPEPLIIENAQHTCLEIEQYQPDKKPRKFIVVMENGALTEYPED
ncbi:hypothetical protein JYT36_00800 [Bacteroidales bacterium AH-315-N07]|nr:hypothetical protein [Bacteroidales bacterium AH-315-N07]